MKKFQKKLIPAKLEPYKGVIYFIIVLLLSNFFWKLTVKGDESDALVSFLGMDISAPFNFMARHIANTAVNILQFFGLDVKLDHNLIRYADGNGVRIVWACTGLKQMYIFFCIIVFTSGKWKNKLWYVPAGLVVVHLFNLMRITVITAIVESHFEWFEFLHERLFKYLFYGVIFLMWMLWDEKIVRRQK